MTAKKTNKDVKSPSNSSSAFNEIAETNNNEVVGFLISGAVWSIIYLLIPTIIWLINRDFTRALSITGKIGIGMIALSFVLLGASDREIIGTAGSYAASREAVKSDISKDSQKEVDIDMLVLQIFGPTGVWMLLWGIFYVIPYAFGVPFLPNR